MTISELSAISQRLLFSGAHHPRRQRMHPTPSERHVGRFVGAPTSLLGQYPLNMPTNADMRGHMRTAKVTWGELDSLEEFLRGNGYKPKHNRSVWEMMVFVMNQPAVWRQLLTAGKDGNKRLSTPQPMVSTTASIDPAYITFLGGVFQKMDQLFSLSYRQNHSVLTVPEEDIDQGRYRVALLDTTTPPLRIYRGHRSSTSRHEPGAGQGEAFLPLSSGFTVPYFLNPLRENRDGLAGDNATVLAPITDEPPRKTHWLMRLMAPLLPVRRAKGSHRRDDSAQFPLVLDAINDRLQPSLRIRSRLKSAPILITPAQGKPIRLMPGTSDEARTYVTPADPKARQPLLIEVEDEQHDMFVTAQPLISRQGQVTRMQWFIKGYPKA